MVDRQRLIIDTNVFMENLETVKDLMDGYKIYIPYVVLQELDHLKISDSSTKSYKARMLLDLLMTIRIILVL